MRLTFGMESLIQRLRPSVLQDVWDCGHKQYPLYEHLYWEALVAKALAEAGALYVSDLPYRLAALTPEGQRSVIQLAASADVQDYLYKKVAPILLGIPAYRYEGWQVSVSRLGWVLLQQQGSGICRNNTG